jgi:hypothetical protein
MNKSGIFRFVFQFLIVFIMVVSMAACSDVKIADHISDPISTTTNSATPATPKESVSKDNPIIVSVQPSPSATQESENAAPASPKAASASPSAAPTATPEKGIMLSITGDDKVGVILGSTLVEVEGEVSVMTLLQNETRKEKIQMESSGKGIFAYVKGIANLYEFDRGAKSGWLFKVNGTFADKGAGSYKVKSGDQVEWLYTLDLGKDVGDKR